MLVVTGDTNELTALIAGCAKDCTALAMRGSDVIALMTGGAAASANRENDGAMLSDAARTAFDAALPGAAAALRLFHAAERPAPKLPNGDDTL